jgi:tRNA-splicing ligase RtcB
MHCDVVAFLTPELFQRTEDELWSQAYQAAAYPGVRHAYLMPDTHLGFGVPIGSVIVTEDTVIQAGSGYDISCGVLYMRVPDLHASDVVDPAQRRQWIEEVELRVPTGIGSHRPPLMPQYTEQQVLDVLQHGAQALGVSSDLCERQSLPVDERHFDPRRIRRAYSKALPQLGSLGGGNHFLELQVDRHDGSVWVMVHCGSRGYGWQTAEHYFFAGAERCNLPRGRREEAWMQLDDPLGQQFWAHHNSAANYAIANRHTIAESVQEATRVVFGKEPEVFYEISHNLVQAETVLLPDGGTVQGLVHRKGATRALPAGHPDLAGGRWADTGHPCLIPGSMLQGAAILYPAAGAPAAGCSVNHGSGRVVSRKQAKRELRPFQGEIDAEMQSIKQVCDGVEITGIMTNHRRTPLDECDRVYKALDDVLEILEQEQVATVANRMVPVANLKGLD